MPEPSQTGERDPFIDVLRVAVVLIVVVGHWATTTVIWEEGRIVGENALSVLPESHLVTWLLQVMPLVFFVGGFANARSLARHDGDYLAYLRSRVLRLMSPTLVFILVWLVLAAAAEVAPLPDPNVVERAADVAALPFWFLGLYIATVSLAPPMRWLHDRVGPWVPVALVVGAVVVDGLVHGAGYDAAGVANYAFVWLLPHQLGYFYADGRLDRVPRAAAAAIAAAGLAGLIVAVTAGGYPVSMIGVPGEDRWNTNPPSIAIIALTAWLLGLALLVRRPLQSWATTRRAFVVGLNRAVLTVYLWHVTALSIAAVIVYPLGYPRPATGSSAWWLLRPLWLVIPVPVLAGLVAACRRYEVHPAPRPMPRWGDHRARLVGAGLGVLLVGFGILGFGVTGFDAIARRSGESLLELSMNPLQGVVHLALGIAVLWAVWTPRPVHVAVAAVATAICIIGVWGWSNGIELFAVDPAGARVHLIAGSLGLGLLGLAAVRDRRAVTV